MELRHLRYFVAVADALHFGQAAANLGIDRQAELLDVQLLDVLASVEAVLRHGREIQREALRVRGVPSPTTNVERAAAATTIRDRVDQMHSDCMTLCRVVDDVRRSAVEFERLMGT
jgi:DNA-binding transcriptional LysR family regulator